MLEQCLSMGTKLLKPAMPPAFRCGRAAISPVFDRASTAPNGLSNGLIWPKGRLRLDRL